jgi:histidinol-phosphate aminotransferase
MRGNKIWWISEALTEWKGRERSGAPPRCIANRECRIATLIEMDEKRVPIRVRPEVLAAATYQQGKRPERVGFKLSSNENPYDPLPQVLDSLHKRTDINRYASPAMNELRTRIAVKFGAEAENEHLDVSAESIHMGAGSVSLLYQLIHAVAGPGDNYVFSWPSFEAYPNLGLASAAEPIRAPLAANGANDLDALADAMTERTRAVIVCSPNNPTGPTVSSAAFTAFMERVPAQMMVILDEAYAEFVTDDSAVRGAEQLSQYKNLVVLRTFSKAYGLASLRVGYGVADPAIWEAVAPTVIPLAFSGVAEAAALASLAPETSKELSDRVREITVRRDRLVHQLRELELSVPDAQGNFVWLPESDVIRSASLADAFAERGTLVRPFPGEGVRITVGEAESTEEVVNTLKEYLHDKGERRD